MNDQQKDLMAELGARDAKRCAAMDEIKRNANGEFSSSAGGTKLEKSVASQKKKVEKISAAAKKHNAKLDSKK